MGQRIKNGIFYPRWVFVESFLNNGWYIKVMMIQKLWKGGRAKYFKENVDSIGIKTFYVNWENGIFFLIKIYICGSSIQWNPLITKIGFVFAFLDSVSPLFHISYKKYEK